MTIWFDVLSFCLKVLTLIGHLALLLFALMALAGGGTLIMGLLVIAAIAFVVVNARVLFPWPERRQEMQGNVRFAHITLWIALPFALLCCAAGAFGVHPFNDWLISFMILAMTSALNLLVLQLPHDLARQRSKQNSSLNGRT